MGNSIYDVDNLIGKFKNVGRLCFPKRNGQFLYLYYAKKNVKKKDLRAGSLYILTSPSDY